MIGPSRKISSEAIAFPRSLRKRLRLLRRSVTSRDCGGGTEVVAEVEG